MTDEKKLTDLLGRPTGDPGHDPADDTELAELVTLFSLEMVSSLQRLRMVYNMDQWDLSRFIFLTENRNLLNGTNLLPKSADTRR